MNPACKDTMQTYDIHALIQGVLSEGVKLGGIFGIFLVDEKEDPNTTISGPSSTRQQNAIKWCFASVPMMTQHSILAW